MPYLNSSERCRWRFKPHSMWHCDLRWVYSDVMPSLSSVRQSKNCTAWRYLCSFQMSRTTWPYIQEHNSSCPIAVTAVIKSPLTRRHFHSQYTLRIWRQNNGSTSTASSSGFTVPASLLLQLKLPNLPLRRISKFSVPFPHPIQRVLYFITFIFPRILTATIRPSQISVIIIYISKKNKLLLTSIPGNSVNLCSKGRGHSITIQFRTQYYQQNKDNLNIT